MSTHLLNVPLNELRTNDEQELGSVYTAGGKSYRWVKNLGSTNLTAGGPALIVHSGATIGNIMHKVISADAGVATALPFQPAGSCVAAIAKTGSDTGSYGWVQVKGAASVNLIGLGVSTSIAVGSFAIASSTHNDAWATSHTPTADSASTSYAYAKKVELLQIQTTALTTAKSTITYVHCL